MKALAKLKQDLELIKDLGGVIDAFKTAALVQFCFFQGKEKLNADYLKELEAGFKLLIERKVSSPYLAVNEGLPQGIVIITSDEGFLGELNILCINAAFERKQSDRDEIIILGERGARYLEDRGDRFVFFPGITETIDSNESQKIINYLLSRYNKKFGRIIIVSPEFISLTSQRISVFPFLPYSFSSSKLDIGKKMGDILIEPFIRRVINSLVHLWMDYKLLEIFSSAKQAEFAARIMHLEGSTQELNVVSKKVTLSYFKQVHALSDKAIREISATKILLKKKVGLSGAF
ncbi:MAG: FoF1 ATP synthase subunit gamma [Candidatus Omnitrophota bacterium]|nr:F0F1 ATP synthase subunit gamma [Candidatus Omnitrophota bacterium]